jgi:hypothetical protein
VGAAHACGTSALSDGLGGTYITLGTQLPAKAENTSGKEQHGFDEGEKCGEADADEPKWERYQPDERRQDDG